MSYTPQLVWWQSRHNSIESLQEFTLRYALKLLRISFLYIHSNFPLIRRNNHVFRWVTFSLLHNSVTYFGQWEQTCRVFNQSEGAKPLVTSWSLFFPRLARVTCSNFDSDWLSTSPYVYSDWPDLFTLFLVSYRLRRKSFTTSTITPR